MTDPAASSRTAVGAGPAARPARDLIVVGTGAFAEVATAYFEAYGGHTVIAYACHARYREAETFNGRPVLALETLHLTHPPSDALSVFVAIGYRKMNTLRQAVFDEVTARGWTCATFVHPGVKIWPSTRLGRNVFIFEDNTIQPFTAIGDNTILWSGNHLGHHSTVGRHCFVSSHVVISGSCRLGDNLFIGVNATFHDGLNIADHCLIGAGALITRDTTPHEVYVPASTKPFPKASHELDF